MVRPMGTLLQEEILYTRRGLTGANKNTMVRSIATPLQEAIFYSAARPPMYKNTMVLWVHLARSNAHFLHCGAASQPQEKTHLFPGVKKCINLGDPPGGRGGVPKS